MDKKKKVNPWVSYVKSYAKHTNQSYGCALTNPKTREAYQKYRADVGGVENEKEIAQIKANVAKKKAAEKKTAK
jgi:hypothetical protein